MHDSGLKLPAVATDDEHFVAFDADRDGSAAAEFARSISIGLCRVVFGDVLQAVNVKHDRRSPGTGGELPMDLSLSVRPVFLIAAGDVSVAMVDFFGAATDGFVQVWRWLRLGLGKALRMRLRVGFHWRILLLRSCTNSGRNSFPW